MEKRGRQEFPSINTVFRLCVFPVAAIGGQLILLLVTAEKIRLDLSDIHWRPGCRRV
jgi:hypothetical protein